MFPISPVENKPRPDPRFLIRVLTLRDVRDVERQVAAYFDGLDLSEAERRVTVVGAVRDVYRIDRALPPERPLLPVLDVLLTDRAARLRARHEGPLSRVA